MPSVNLYDNKPAIAQMVAAGKHREAVGGGFEAIGQLQIRLLKSEGLKPHHYVLDIGCGCLRTGVPLVDYLDAGHYYGTDISQELLDAGYNIELAKAGLQHKLPRHNLITDGGFDFSWCRRQFEFALAQSVFTHLPLSEFRLCLARLSATMTPGGRLYATIFEIPETHQREVPFRHEPRGIISHVDRDPFHCRFSDVVEIAPQWTVERIVLDRPSPQQFLRLTLR